MNSQTIIEASKYITLNVMNSEKKEKIMTKKERERERAVLVGGYSPSSSGHDVR